MRFDVDRAMESARALAFPRADRGEGERRAADLVAEELGRAGLFVERQGLEWWSFSVLLHKLYYGIILGGLTLITLRGFPLGWRIGLTLAGAAWPLPAFWLRGRRDRGITSRPGTILGKTAPESSTLPRIILVTNLGVRPRKGDLLRVGAINGLLRGTYAVLLELNFAALFVRNPTLSTMMNATLIACWLMHYPVIWEPGMRPARPSPGDNRTGLALMIELARSLPAQVQGRVDVQFTFLSPIMIDLFGLRALQALSLRTGDERPTLIVHLETPGLGGEILLFQGTGRFDRGPALRLAEEVAVDLWLPHRVRTGWLGGPGVPGVLSLYNGLRDERVGVRGDRSAGQIDPAMLAATAQLTTELILRWAKRQKAGIHDDNLA